MDQTQNQKIHASTQKFTQILDIIDNVVLFEGGYAALVIEITASNFALLSKKEQDARMASYAALLNSLSFPIQIMIRNKRVDISSYINSLEEEEAKTPNALLAKHIHLYKEFVREMIRVNVVLNKTFYVVLPFSSLEAGATGVKQVIIKTDADKEAFASLARKMLQSKAETLHPQLQKLAVASRTLEKEELIKLFYDIYNDDVIEAAQTEIDVNTPMVKGQQNV